MRKFILSLILCFAFIGAFAQTYNNIPTFTWQRAATSKGYVYRANMGSLGFSQWYTTQQVDSLIHAVTVNSVTSFNGRTGAVTPLISDYNTFYEVLTNKAMSVNNSSTLYPTNYAITHYAYPKSHLDSLVKGLIRFNTNSTIFDAGITLNYTAEFNAGSNIEMTDFLGNSARRYVVWNYGGDFQITDISNHVGITIDHTVSGGQIVDGLGVPYLKSGSVPSDTTALARKQGSANMLQNSYTGSYSVYKNQSSAPTTPATGYTNLFFDNLGRVNFQKSDGYLRTLRFTYPTSVDVRMPYKASSILVDSTDNAALLANKVGKLLSSNSSVFYRGDNTYNNSLYGSVAPTSAADTASVSMSVVNVNTAAGSNAMIRLRNTGTENGAGIYKYGANGTFTGTFVNSLFIQNFQNGALVMGTNNSNQFTILANNRFGFNTMAPAYSADFRSTMSAATIGMTSSNTTNGAYSSIKLAGPVGSGAEIYHYFDKGSDGTNDIYAMVVANYDVGRMDLKTSNATRLSISSTGAVNIPNLATAGVVHNAVTTGLLSTSLVQSADLASSLAIPGSPTTTTQTAGTNNTTIATTAFVATSYAPLASPAFTGTPTAPTAGTTTSTTQIATTAFVQNLNYINRISPLDSIAGVANGAQRINHNLVLQSASASVPGLVNNTNQTFSGFKTFSNVTTFSSNINVPGSNGINFINGSNTLNLSAAPTVVGRTQSFQDASGVIALTSDISSATDNIISKTANYTIVSGDFAVGKKSTLDVYVDATAGNVTITLPSATTFAGYTIYVTKTDASANTVTISGLNGSNTETVQYQSRQANTAPSIGWVNH